jgi:hypothetical protein
VHYFAWSFTRDLAFTGGSFIATPDYDGVLTSNITSEINDTRLSHSDVFLRIIQQEHEPQFNATSVSAEGLACTKLRATNQRWALAALCFPFARFYFYCSPGLELCIAHWFCGLGEGILVPSSTEFMGIWGVGGWIDCLVGCWVEGWKGRTAGVGRQRDRQRELGRAGEARCLGWVWVGCYCVFWMDFAMNISVDCKFIVPEFATCVSCALCARQCSRDTNQHLRQACSNTCNS